MLDEDEALTPTEPYCPVTAYVWVVAEKCIVVAQHPDEALLLAHALGVSDVSRRTPIRRAFQADIDRMPNSWDMIRASGDPVPA